MSATLRASMTWSRFQPSSPQRTRWYVMQSSQRRTALATKPRSFLGLGAERAGLVGLMVEGEEALDAEVAAGKDFFVEVSAKFLEVVEAVGHGSSGLGFCHSAS